VDKKNSGFYPAYFIWVFLWGQINLYACVWTQKYLAVNLGWGYDFTGLGLAFGYCIFYVVTCGLTAKWLDKRFHTHKWIKEQTESSDFSGEE